MAKQRHWIVREGTDCMIYEQVNYVPSDRSSRILAEEIDGMARKQAMKVLREMYDRVVILSGSSKIFCYRNKGANDDDNDNRNDN